MKEMLHKSFSPAIILIMSRGTRSWGLEDKCLPFRNTICNLFPHMLGASRSFSPHRQVYRKVITYKNTLVPAENLWGGRGSSLEKYWSWILEFVLRTRGSRTAKACPLPRRVWLEGRSAKGTFGWLPLDPSSLQRRNNPCLNMNNLFIICSYIFSLHPFE